MTRLILILFIIFLFSGCTKVNTSFDNLNNGRIYIIGHAGSGFSSFSNYYPPNSWNSVIRAIEIHNADGVEIDVQLSKDSTLFMFHDKTLDQMCSCKGCTHDYDSAQLVQCHFKTVQGQITTENISTLESVIDRFSKRPIKPQVFLDLHFACSISDTSGIYPSEEVDVLYNLINKYNAFDWIHLQSIKRDMVLKIRQKDPRLKVLLDNVSNEEDIEFAASNGCFGIAATNTAVTEVLVKAAHQKGLFVQLYGATSKNDLVNTFNKSPDFYLADDILLAQNVLK